MQVVTSLCQVLWKLTNWKQHAGPVTISTGALTFTYDANDLGALALAPTTGDGEDDNYGDYSVAFLLVALV